MAVTISDTTPGAAIYYTTNGSNPSQSSASITSGSTILISQNATLNVQAFLSGTTTSDLVTAQYGINGAVSAGAAHSLALLNNGTVWAWGDNSCGELGNGTTTSSSTPVQVLVSAGTPLSGVVALAADNNESVAVDNSGNVWAWGLNTNGELGIGTTTNATFATHVGGLSGIVGIASAQNHTLAVKNDGSVWAWGADASGQVGNGTATAWVTQPVQVVGVSGQGHLQGIVAVAAGASHSLALDQNGKVWAWGGNGAGQLGNGDTTLATQSAPVQVKVSGTGFTNVAAVAAGPINSFALRNDGSTWAWGDNTIGELGSGTTTPASPVTPGNLSPAPVASLTGTMVAVTNQAALDTSNTIWAWGDNTTDRLGADIAGNYATLPLVVNLSAGTPTLSISAGNGQTVSDGSFSTPLTITATSNGSPVANALIDFIVTQGSGLIVSSTSSPQYSGILQVKTNSSGQAFVYYQEPGNGSGSSDVLATSGNQQSSFFTLLSGGFRSSGANDLPC